jgi:hypothetical protein
MNPVPATYTFMTYTRYNLKFLIIWELSKTCPKIHSKTSVMVITTLTYTSKASITPESNQLRKKYTLQEKSMNLIRVKE